jgi:signal transduction histidine kinase
VIARLTFRYVAVFACVLAALSIAAYLFLARETGAYLGPALGTPEGIAGYRVAMRHVLATIVSFDVPLLIVVTLASAYLARTSLQPLIAARERERLFVADAAHDLRSPLASIATVAQAQRADATPAQRAAFDLIAQTALDASSLLGDLLTLAREPERRLLVREPVDVGAIAKTCADEYEPRAKARTLHFECEASSAIVEGDARRLRELTRNLLDNAVRHAHSQVRVRALADGTFAEIHVSNDGEPIAAEMRPKLFNRYQRETNDGTGTGLGLAIVHWIALAHGGDVRLLDSRAGAEFVVRLPLISIDRA